MFIFCAPLIQVAVAFFVGLADFRVSPRIGMLNRHITLYLLIAFFLESKHLSANVIFYERILESLKINLPG